MFLDAIALTRTLPCLAEPGKIIAIGKPNRLFDEALPYLATLPGIIAYNPDAQTLTFRRPAGFMALYADRVYITQLKSADEGLELLAALRDAINATWGHREELTAVTQARQSHVIMKPTTRLARPSFSSIGNTNNQRSATQD
jgi:ArsR family metal-binding transcriptional regulator